MIREREIGKVGERRERQERGERRREGETCMGVEGERKTERETKKEAAISFIAESWK